MTCGPGIRDDGCLPLASGDASGTLPLLVFLHGLGCAASRDWPPIAASPRLRGRASLWVDLLGFGRSPRPPGADYSLPAQAASMTRLLERRREPLALVGHSMGGTLAVMVAERLALAGRPPAAVLLAEPNLRPEDASLSAGIVARPEEEFVAAWSAFVEGLDSAWYRESVRLADPVAYHRSAVSLVEHGAAMLARFFALPVGRKGYVLGGRSNADTQETAGLVAAGGVPVACVSNAGHNFSEDDPAGFAAALAELLDGPAR